MEIVKANRMGIAKAVKILQGGGTVVYPTDTAYALGGIFNSRKAANKILKIKERRDPKFTLVASSFEQVKKNFNLNRGQISLAKKYWPSALSIVVSKKFAVRVPDNQVARALAKGVDKPMIATSANLSGQKTLYHSREIIRQFKNKKNVPDLLLDAGALKRIEVSTIVVVKKDKAEILRQGSVRLAAAAKVK
ncbi:MAG: L-threonylcarbamoyladenylate synthase [Patescibacteria group bacterium]|jgi:L-threonylcarbamoyladenylate synthase|nr:L-threonylcarbamoyladenylate synthase [Patescibacteria group bacterium]